MMAELVRGIEDDSWMVVYGLGIARWRGWREVDEVL